MAQVILVKYGEIVLKGLNRRFFEDRLVANIRARIRDLRGVKFQKAQATIYIEPENEAEIDRIIERIRRVFGIVSITRAYVCEKEMGAILQTAVRSIGPELAHVGTFKVEAKRSDKGFAVKSPEICAQVGQCLLESVPGLKVDVKHPDATVFVEVRDFGAYVYCTKIPGLGGMPTGTNGRAALLLSGGIDSPVAGYMIAKRGVELHAVHFYSYPYTSPRAREKVVDLAKILAGYTGRLCLHVVPFTDIQLKLNEYCPPEQLTILMRRLMMRISERIAEENGCLALVTGESIGQVASQTMESLFVTDAAVEMPVFRPLIGMDKEEICVIARKIGTFETSILPYEDCCTVFTPRHPNTKPKLPNILKSEQLVEWEELIQAAMEGTEQLELSYRDTE